MTRQAECGDDPYLGGGGPTGASQCFISVHTRSYPILNHFIAEFLPRNWLRSIS